MELERFLVLIDDIIKNKISDLHFTTNEFPHIRNHVGDIVPVEPYGKLSEADIDRICEHLLEKPFTEKTLDVSYER